MSIRDCIEDNLAAGELIELLPQFPGAPTMRRVLVNHHVFNYLKNAPGTPRDLIPKIADTRFVLDNFTTGAEISVCMQPYKSKHSTQLALLDAERAIWEFRVSRPKPLVRVFGMFAQRDTFVALDYGHRGKVDFSASMNTTESQWAVIFDKLSPFSGENINDYISDKYRIN